MRGGAIDTGQGHNSAGRESARSHGLFDEHFVLDFASTLERRYTRREDRIATTADLAGWLHAAGIPTRLGRLGASEVRAAHALRDAMYGLGRNAVLRKPYDGDDVEVVNRYAACTPLTASLGSAADLHLVGDFDALLSSIARGGIDLFTSASRSSIRQCEADECTRLFLDRSRTGARRWCCVACANRVKSAAYRQRKKSRGSDQTR